jgi:hypothetical protein
LAVKLKVEYDRHKDCMEKFLNSVRELKIAILEKIQMADATIASIKTEIEYFETKIKDLKGKN